MATATEKVPEVYKGIAEILKSLSVEKNGVLPGNMGGKPYITAVDTAAETKRQFVANNLIFLPSEEVVKHETIIHKDRLNIAIVIKGTYTIVSTLDGSSVTVSGTGDGLATGTAVASNIGSTNALKNALLRTFLITEQSVEDASKQEATDTGVHATAASQKVDRARTATKPAAVEDLNALKAKVREFIEGADNTESARKKVVDLQNTLKTETGKTGLELQKELNKRLGL